MTPEAEVLKNLVSVLLVAGFLAVILIIHFIVVLEDLRKQVRQLQRAVRGFPGNR